MNVRYLSPLLFLFLIPSTISKGPDPIDVLRKMVYPLYEFEEATSIQCLGSSLALTQNGTIAIQATSAHCEQANRAKNQNGKFMRQIAKTPKVIIRVNGYDIQMSLRPYCREWIPGRLDRIPVPGDEYYALGHKNPNEQFRELRVIRLLFVRHDPEYGYIFSRGKCSGEDCNLNMESGVSGGPIIDAEGNPVALYHGFRASKIEEFHATPLAPMLPLIESAARSLDRVNPLTHCGG